MAGKTYSVVRASRSEQESIAMPLHGSDPYFIWALLTQGEGLGLVQSRMRSANSSGVQTRYLQVLIELPEEGDPRRVSLANLARGLTPCMRLRGAYKESEVGNERRWILRRKLTHATALVEEAWLLSFLQQMKWLDIRWEIGHARVSIDSRESSAAANPKRSKVQQFEKYFSKADSKLSGKVMVIIDHGCPFAHPAYRNNDGGTRVRYLWLQDSTSLRPGKQYARPIKHGTEYTLFPYGWDLRGSELDALMKRHVQPGGSIDEEAVYTELGYELMQEQTSHGAHVMSLACGTPNPLTRNAYEDRLFGLASATSNEPAHSEPDQAGACEIIFVQLPHPTVKDTSGGNLQVHLLDAVHYALDRVTEDAELVFVCSFGTHSGPHNGSRLVDKALSNVLKNSHLKLQPEMIFPVGNSFNAACHAQRIVSPEESWHLRVDVAADKGTNTFVEWWIPSNNTRLDQFLIRATTPNRESLLLAAGDQACTLSHADDSELPYLTLIRNSAATATHHRLMAVIGPTAPSKVSKNIGAPYGHWSFELVSHHSQSVEIDARIERDDAFFSPQLDQQSRFVTPPQIDLEEEHQHCSVTKRKTQSSFAATPGVKIAGALTRTVVRDTAVLLDDHRALIAPYSASSDGETPQFLAYVDDSSDLRGRLASGHRAQTWVRCNGTSMAAPQVARALLNAMPHLTPSLNQVSPTGVGTFGQPLSEQGVNLQRRRLGQAQTLSW